MSGWFTRCAPCPDCGVLVTKKANKLADMLCTECGIARANVAAREMAAHSGPAYEKFLAARWPNSPLRGQRTESET